MKTLNRTLSLVLVLVMVLGFFGVAGAAFTDQTKITYKEAVDVMSAIGVIDGMGDNTFAPTGNLTREQAAKIICYLTMGKAAADKLTVTVAPFKDVAADRWSAGSIAYGVQQGIIAGRGDGTFDPTANVTGYEFAKMLLVALGYDAAVEQFTGPSWALNVAKRTFQNKLTTGNDAFNGNAPATREEAALSALNLIQAREVTYATKGTEIKLPDGTTIRQGASAPSQDPITNPVFMTNHFRGLSVTNTADTAGRSVRVWRNGATTIGSYASSAAAVSWTADHTGATDTTVERALAGYTYAATINVYTNGAASTIVSGYTAAIKALTGNGKLVEVFADANNAINRVSVTYAELATIINKDTINKTVTVNDGTSQVTLTEKSDVAAFGGAYTALYNKNVGDKVLLTSKAAAGTITAIFNYADSAVIAGQFTSLKDGAYTIGGKAYEAADGASLSLTLGLTYSLFLDSYGYLKGVNASATTTTYALMLQGSRDGTAMGGYSYNAQLLFGDGSVKWVAIGAYNGDNAESAKTTAFGLSNVFVGYTALADGSYALAGVSPATDVIGSAVTITKDSSSFNSKLVSNSTVFLIYNATTKTFDSYKGIKNVPTTHSSSAFGLLNAGSTAYGMVVVKTSSTSTADVIYVYDTAPTASEFVNGTTVYTYKAIVNGVIGTVKSTASSTSVGLKLGSTYTNGVITTFGSTAADTSVITGSGDVVISKANAATKVLAAGPVAANKISLTDGILAIGDVPASFKNTTGIVGDTFVCYVVDATAKTVTVKSLSSTPSNVAGSALNLVVDANGYVAYAILVAA